MRQRRVILLIENVRAFDNGLLRGVARYARSRGPWTFFRQPPFFVRTYSREKLLDSLRHWEADGIICREKPYMQELLGLKIPMVVSPYRQGLISGAVNIVGADLPIGIMGAEHFLERGFRHFAFCGLPDMYWSQARCDSFCARVHAAGFQAYVYQSPRAATKRLWENEPAFMAAWLERLPRPLGLMVSTDERAQQIIESCRIAGLAVPDDVAVLGVDNDELICDLSAPPLSSIAQQAEKAGFQAAATLERMMQGRRLPHEVLTVEPGPIVTRQSTDILAVDDPQVRSALQYIRTHGKQPILIDEVAQATSLSRRMLEKRFRRILGRSLLSEIKRVRCEHIATLLRETDLPVVQIAAILGFSSHENISRYFKQQKGITPRQWREQYQLA